MSGEAFTDAIQALSRLYTHAADSGNTPLRIRTEAATRELLGWHDAVKHAATKVDFPPRSEDITR